MQLSVHQQKLSHCDHSAFYQNLKHFKLLTQISLSDRMFILFNPHVAATYDGKKTTPSYITKKKRKQKIQKIFNTRTTSLGVGLNEKYTEYLNRKYFSNNKEVSSYTQERHLAKGIEKIIGQKR